MQFFEKKNLNQSCLLYSIHYTLYIDCILGCSKLQALQNKETLFVCACRQLIICSHFILEINNSRLLLKPIVVHN